MRAVIILAIINGTSRSVPHQTSVGVIYLLTIRQRGLGMIIMSSLVRVHFPLFSFRSAFFTSSALPASSSTMSYN